MEENIILNTDMLNVLINLVVSKIPLPKENFLAVVLPLLKCFHCNEGKELNCL